MNFPLIDWWQAGANLLSISVAYLLALPVEWDRERNARSLSAMIRKDDATHQA